MARIKNGAFFGEGGAGLYQSQEPPSVDKEKELEEFASLAEWEALRMRPAKQARFLQYLMDKKSGATETNKLQGPKEPPILSREADDKFWSNPEEMKKYTRKKL